MNIAGLFTRVVPPAAAPAAAVTAPRRFTRDRAGMFDLAKTQLLSELFGVARAARDAEWAERLVDCAWTASVVIHDPPTFTGPDGFPYLRLDLPPPGTPFDSNAMANMADLCLERATGIALFASAADTLTEQQFVFPVGVIDAIVRYDSALGDPQDRRERVGQDLDGPVDPASGLQSVTTTEHHDILLGTPSASYLPAYTARALLHHLRDGWGIADPRVQLMADPKLHPTRSLVIGRKPSEFPPGTQVNTACQRLMWYLPPGRSLMLMLETWDVAGMARLADLGGRVEAGGMEPGPTR